MSGDFRQYPANNAAGTPTVFEPVDAGVDLVDWTVANQAAIASAMAACGAVLFRGFAIPDRAYFGKLVGAMCTPVEYTYRSTPRTSVGTNIYTATEYPKAYTIPVHCENAYQSTWPLKLFFYCEQAAAAGGETPLVNIRAVTQKIDEGVKDLFRQRDILYVRNYGSGVDLDWKEVFQTSERSDVELFCRDNDIAFEWKKSGGLRTKQRRPALAIHPRSGEELWFNQAHLFHVSSLDEATRAAMTSIFKEEDLPRNSYFGDGGRIDEEVLRHIREQYAACTFTFPWEKNDILMVDNMALGHGRNPFSGDRTVLVMMGDAHDPASLPVRRDSVAAADTRAVPV